MKPNVKLHKEWLIKLIDKKLYFVIMIFDTTSSFTDFAVTPYLYAVWFEKSTWGAKGFGFCWGFYAIHFAFANIKKTSNKDTGELK